MALTPAQLTTLKNYINTVPEWAALPNDVQRDYGEDFYKTSRFKLENYVSQQVMH